jgi:hypothetical protein
LLSDALLLLLPLCVLLLWVGGTFSAVPNT